MKVGLVGDIMLGGSFNSTVKNGQTSVWGDVGQFLEDYDFVGGNLETTLTSSNIPWSGKNIGVNLDPTYAKYLYPFNYLSLANNHILDYHVTGLRQTKNALNEMGILSSGAGATLTEAKRPALYKHPKGNLLLFSASDHPNYWAAGRETILDSRGLKYLYKGDEGIWSVDIENGDWGHILEEVRKARDTYKSETFIFSIHWGSNWQNSVPSPQVQRFSEDLLRNGVNIIHGHSPHHLQKIDMINGGAVFYSLGNLIDDKLYHNNIGGIGTVELEKNVITSLSLIPTKISHNPYQVNLVTDIENATFAQNMVTY